MFQAALGIHLHDEVPALHAHDGGVAPGVEQQAHVQGTVGRQQVLNVEFAEKARYVVLLLQVAVNVDVSAGTYRQGLVCDSERIEVQAIQLRAAGGMQAVGVQEGIGGDDAVEELVVPRYAGNGVAVVQSCCANDGVELMAVVV